MPMIALTTNQAISGEQSVRLKDGLGQAIALIPGKSEARLMISLTGGAAMFFQGEPRQAAFLEVSCFGHPDAASYERLTGVVCELLEEVLGVPPENVYIKYSETDHWGWNGRNL